MTHRLLLVAAIAGAIAWPSNAGAAEPADLDARLAFLEARIDAQRTHAEVWWGGWLLFYSSGTIVQGVRAAAAETPVDRADLWVSFVKAGGGVVRLAVDPYQGIEGLEPRPEGATRRDLALRLARAEEILQHNAKRTHAFGVWYAHLINLSVNAIGAVIVGAGYDGWRQGLISAGIGFGVGEAMLLTSPWEADWDLDEYGFVPQLSLVPYGEGAALQLRF